MEDAMEDRLFEEVLGATREALVHYRGAKRDLRTTILPEPPRPMSRVEVHRLRHKVKVSQAVFAKCLNVSTKLVQAWEGGIRHPEGAALRLLRIAERAPGLVFVVGTKAAESRSAVAEAPHRRRLARRKLARA
jgi:putative transcriptional regulator